MVQCSANLQSTAATGLASDATNLLQIQATLRLYFYRFHLPLLFLAVHCPHRTLQVNVGVDVVYERNARLV